ncbi:MAG TPA: phosphatidylglycerol lysyltransferase domain-containing protein [Clostridiales bacterium]|nr:phosphatidylglycerol lysyltransferase domain-containing protein [Clostridiales bacterium]HRT82388.1 phosphatidylglycerol lysyltransferase domain-containing protein [Oscillospiraceae bacterium]
MLDFRYPELEDQEWVRELLEYSQYMGSEYSFGNIYMWSRPYKTKITRLNNSLITKSYGDTPSYCCPAGNDGFEKVLPFLMQDAKDCGHAFRMHGISRECTLKMENLFTGKFEFTERRDTFDYIYRTEDLINLSGRKYRDKRNHISAFLRDNDWSFEIINEENLQECIDLNNKWDEQKREADPDSISSEQEAIERGFDKYFELDMVGGLIRSSGEVVAFTMGERLNKTTFCVHFEKALADVRGAYPMINREFVANCLKEYTYVNREEDVGDPGLRKAKLSYNPAILLEKYSLKLKEE